MTDESPYRSAWFRYRLWGYVCWIAFFSFLPGVAVIDRVVRKNDGEAANSVSFLVAIGWIAAFAVAGSFKGNFACPRCRESFFRKWDDRPWRKSFQYNPFAVQCMHCGLTKWAPRNE